jgi:pimeloyl-ACP methyl ester carboxylesterase
MPDYAQGPGWLNTELMSKGYRTNASLFASPPSHELASQHYWFGKPRCAPTTQAFPAAPRRPQHAAHHLDRPRLSRQWAGPLADLVRRRCPGPSRLGYRLGAVLPHWDQAVRDGIDQAPGPVWLVAHSFGCLAAVLAASSRPERVAGLMLVAPADPERFTPQGLRDASTAPEQPSLARWIPRSPLGPPAWWWPAPTIHGCACRRRPTGPSAGAASSRTSARRAYQRGFRPRPLAPGPGTLQGTAGPRATSPLAPSHAAPGAVTASRCHPRDGLTLRARRENLHMVESISQLMPP